MIRTIGITLATIFLFALMAWTTMAASPTQQQQAILQQQVNYTLPYPGILPDSPLYPLKAFRDKVVSMFITDAKKQAQFDLLQADKRLVATQMLLAEKNPNDQLISQTISKGENYFDEAIKNIVIAKKEGQFVNDFVGLLKDAGIKHEQVLVTMAQSSSGQLRQDLLMEVVRVQGFENQAKRLAK